MNDEGIEEADRTLGLLTVKQAAKAIDVPVAFLQREVKAGHVPFLKVGSRVRVNVSAVQRALMRQAAGMFADMLYGKLPGPSDPERVSVVDVPAETDVGAEFLPGLCGPGKAE